MVYFYRRHLANLIGVSVDTIYRWCSMGKLVLRRHAGTGKYYVTDDEIEDFKHQVLNIGWWDYREFEKRKTKELKRLLKNDSEE